MARVRVDAHVHSKFSDSLKLPVLARAGSRECYAEPEDLYRLAVERGMDMVTISDHDTIDGALEIAHHGDHVFLSEEVSAVFPENGCIMHVLAWDITEAQHAEIQRLRFNIYELVAYLRQELICHGLAHPLYPVNGRLQREQAEKCLLMFPVLELMNSSRDPYHRTALEAITGALTREDLERWANQYDLEPPTSEPAWAFTGGSDDHSGIAISRGFTEFDGPPTGAGFRAAVRERRSIPAGQNMSAVSFSHNVYTVATQFFVDRRRRTEQPGIYDSLFRVISTGGAAATELGPLDELMASPVGKLLLSLQRELAEGTAFPSAEQLLAGGADEEVHRRVSEIGKRVVRRVLTEYAESLSSSGARLEIDQLPRLLADALQTFLLLLPYYGGFRHVYRDRRDAMTLHQAIGFGFAPAEAPAVAIFVDTLEDVNGVSIGLRRMVRELRGQGRRVHLIGLAIETDTGTPAGVDDLEDLGADTLVTFEPLQSFGIPGYGPEGLDAGHGHRIGIPPVLEMLQWCVENRVELVQVSTPGPVGLAGMAIARLLGAPLVGHYHTNVPEYAGQLLGDPAIAALCKTLVGWFYGALDTVIVPSNATRDTVLEMGVRPERVAVLPRGVDAARFSPDRRDPEVWARYGLTNGLKLVYVGRVSQEKRLDVLLEALDLLRQDGLHADLAIVGDGPYRATLMQHTNGEQTVAYPGYLHGDELPALVASADLFVFPSTTDSFGGAVLEAQAAAVPAIVTERGGPAEIVTHGRTGLVVPADDAEAFSEAIRRLADPAARREMSAAARTKAEGLTHEHAAERLWELYASVLEQDRELRLARLGNGIWL